MGKYFGTDGVRGKANEKLTPKIAFKIGRFIGQYPNGTKNRILIGMDTRVSGAMFDAALIAGLTSSGADVFDLGITTTPSISYLVATDTFDFGIMISASHNPYYDNGIKVFAKTGEKLSADIEALIEEYIDESFDRLPNAINKGVGRFVPSAHLVEEYLDFIQDRAYDISKLKILVDCSHGSACMVAAKLFRERLHCDCTFINDSFTGYDINDRCGSTHIECLVNEMKKGYYDIGVAFDGDADRLIAVAPGGKVVNGDLVIYLNAVDMARKEKLKGNKVVLTTMSNIGLKMALKEKGIECLDVDVGDKYVQAALRDQGLSLGGEQSGHVIFFDDLNTGDGLLTAIKVMNVMVKSNLPLEDLVKDVVIYPQVLENIGVPNKEAVMSHDGLNALISHYSGELGEEGRLYVRASGTEQLVRVMCEAKDIETAQRVVSSVIDYIREIIY